MLLPMRQVLPSGCRGGHLVCCMDLLDEAGITRSRSGQAAFQSFFAGVNWETPFPQGCGRRLEQKMGKYSEHQPSHHSLPSGTADQAKDQAHIMTYEQGTHASKLGLCSRSGRRGVFLAGGDAAVPRGLFSRRQGLEPGLTRAIVPCSWLEILWDTCSRAENVQVSCSAVHPEQRGSSSPV